jgi:hypothetical protein
VPQMRTQPVAARTVAEALVDLASDPDSAPAPQAQSGSFPEVAGPRQESMVEMARLVAARRSEQIRIEGVSDATDPDRDLYESGAHLPGSDAVLTGPTFEEWLDSTV